MKRLLDWLAFSIPALAGYYFESTGFYKAAVHTYALLIKFGYPPAYHRLGILYVSGEGVELNVVKGKELISTAAGMHYKESMLWLDKHGRITQEIASLAKSLLADSENNIWEKARPWIYLAILIILPAYFVVQPLMF